MKNNKKFQFVINIIIIFIFLLIVLYFSLKDNYHEIINAIHNMNPIWILLAICILCIYRGLASLAHYLLIKQNQEQVSYLRCLQINFIILFFHGVTPFAGGGQPMEVYYLHKEGIPFTKATNITLQNFIVYQVSLVLMGVIALIYNMFFNLFPSNHLIKKLVILGFVINFLVLVVTYILSFGEKINRFIIEKAIHLIAKIKLIKNEKETQDKFRSYLKRFHQNALILRKDRKLVAIYIIINMIGLSCLYSMPYVIAIGLGCKITLIEAIIGTAYVMIIGSFVPIPGGTGGIEYGFMFFYSYFIKGSILNAIMLIWRFVSYYLGMIFGAIALSVYRKKEKKCE